MKNTIENVETVAEGKWIALCNIAYFDAYGKKRVWESVSRKESHGAVVIIAETFPGRNMILVRQFRPPTGQFVIEFPAGLIDAGESPCDAAVRELKEETGYVGSVIHESGKNYSSPGLSSEYLYQVLVKVNEAEQHDLTTDFDETESIETFLVPVDELDGFLEKRK